MVKKVNLELKCYCDNFTAVRALLKKVGAKRERPTKQDDTFFNLPTEKSAGRLKLRREGKDEVLVYYVRPDFKKDEGATADAQFFFVHDRELLPLLENALGVRSRVIKTREVWHKDNAVFHLDKVNGVGNVFEIEVQSLGKLQEKDKKLFKYFHSLFLPYLGKIIKGSNGDLLVKK